MHVAEFADLDELSRDYPTRAKRQEELNQHNQPSIHHERGRFCDAADILHAIRME